MVPRASADRRESASGTPPQAAGSVPNTWALHNVAALRRFDELPDEASVRLPVVAALFSVGPATVWRWSKSGTLPAPRKMGGVALWGVGELRQAMKQGRA